MKKIRIISALLAIVMFVGLFANVSVLPVFATTAGETEEKEESRADILKKHLTANVRAPEYKLAQMKKYIQDKKYSLWIHPDTGEWALQNNITGQLMFSNPYDLGTSVATEDIKKQLISQILITYSENGVTDTYNSFEDCVLLNQLKIKKMKNGVRVEYAIGNLETRKLLPMRIKATDFEEEILSKITNERKKGELMSYYQLKDLNDPFATEEVKQQMVKDYPVVKQFPIYVYDASDGEMVKLRNETTIKTYCPEYTFEAMEEDHQECGYESEDKAPAVFKLGLEYTVDDFGLNVRLGANGIRFDESVYTLESIKILPYAGVGNNTDLDSYLFFPDGSGSIIRFEDVLDTTAVNITGKLYGQDYAFHTITGSTQQTMRLPVYGIVETTTRVSAPDENGKTYRLPQTNGFLAVIEEGDTLATMHVETGGTIHDYNTVYTSFNPRPSDKYNLGDSNAASGSAMWTVVSERKYTGSYKVKYIMLEDELLVEEKAGEDYKNYEPSYVGMAKAYRDYLYNQGTLSALENTEEDIPLYIESFGTIDTTEKFLSFPITVETPLTTFDDLMTMSKELEEAGISNVNYKLSGFVNGGMRATAPSKVKFQKEVGGNKGYKEFLSYANEKGIGVYPDFDFSYITNTGAFDGFSFRKDAAKTIDNRYTQKQKYDYVYQMLMQNGNVVISVSAFSKLYDKFSDDYKSLGFNGISVSTLANDLNSDFDEDEPYNREDARYETTKFLDTLKNDFGSVMSDAGNLYALKYVDHLLNVSLDSSRYNSTSQAIPFMGMVLHGSVQFSGSALNTIGNTNYEILKMIENGASPYFLLSYQNTSDLKEDPIFANYFSVDYKIWKEDLVKYYNVINEALSDVQKEFIVDHDFIEGNRIPTTDETELDKVEIAEIEKQNALDKLREETKAQRGEHATERDKYYILVDYYGSAEDVPTTDEPTTDTPATDAPATDAPATDAPATDAPATDAPATDGNTGNTEEKPEEAPKEESAADIVNAKYKTQTGTVVKVTYSNGKTFILNYNSFDITADGQTVPAFGFVVVK